MTTSTGRPLKDEEKELVRAWTAWEENPGHAGVTRDMEDACHIVAEMDGVTVNEFRRQLAEARRGGLGRGDSIRRVRG